MYFIELIYQYNVFTSRKVAQTFLETKTIDTNTWYNDYRQIGEAGYKWRLFKDFVGANKEQNSAHSASYFLQGSSNLNSDTVSQIQIYEQGILVSSDFKVSVVGCTT